MEQFVNTCFVIGTWATVCFKPPMAEMWTTLLFFYNQSSMPWPQHLLKMFYLLYWVGTGVFCVFALMFKGTFFFALFVCFFGQFLDEGCKNMCPQHQHVPSISGSWLLSWVLFALLFRSSAGGLSCKQRSKGNRLHSSFQKPPPRVPNLCPPRFSTSNTPWIPVRWWIRLSAGLAVYCGSKVPTGKRGSHLFVSDPLYHNGDVSQWVTLPSHSFHCQSWEE